MGKKSGLTYGLLLIATIASHVIVFGSLTLFGQEVNKAVFDRKMIFSDKDKYWLCQTIGLWVALYLFGLAVTVMTLRILTGKTTPASGNDPVYIGTLNRIISNTIQQLVIFAGLYVPLLFSEENHMSKIGGTRLLTIASLFVIGRVLFGIGYLLGAVTGISSFRSLGFAIGLVNNIVLVGYHLGFNSYNLLDQHVAPILKSYVN